MSDAAPNMKIATEDLDAPADKVREVKDWAKEPPNPLAGVTTEAILIELNTRLPNLAIVGADKEGKGVRHYQGQWGFLYSETGFLFDEIKSKRLMATMPPPPMPIPTIPRKLRP